MPFVERVVGFESRPSADWIEGVELVPFEDDSRRLEAMLQDFRTDTVVHCGLAADRSGAVAEPSGGDVIQTMRLGAAIGDPKVSVRSWVIASSSDVYPVGSRAPLLNREDAATETDELSISATLSEAEDYARDVAERALHLNVAILRLAPVVGPGLRSPFGRLLDQSPLPTPLGFDPAVQLLHIDDAVDALGFATELELAGIYNVASSGTIRWSEVASALGRGTFPLPPVPVPMLGALMRAVGLPYIPEDLTELLRFGHAVDTAKFSTAGFSPGFDQRGCVSAAAGGNPLDSRPRRDASER
jgi:UDP-glucose 4-epimerase